ncbi:MAG TPA: LysE family transporter [Candidatus Omnitrophota bacterium]|nr:LysE family transporter [Candidatus Omnitrophota bacterium]
MLLGVLTGFLGSALSWQINLIAIQRGLQRGRVAAFLVGCGAVTADMIFLWVAFTGAKPLLNHPEWWRNIRWLGIAVLLFLAARLLVRHGRPRRQDEEVNKRNPSKNFLVGFLVVGTNPAVLLIWAGVISFLLSQFPEARQPFFKEFFLSGFLIGALGWFFPLTFVFLEKLEGWSKKNHELLSRVSASALILVAFYLMFQKC